MKRWLLVTALVLGTGTAASAQALEDYDYENLEFRGIGVDFGGVWPVTVEQTVSFGLRGDLGFVGPFVRIVPSIRFWSSSLRESEVDHLAEQIIRICERQVATSCPSSLDLGEVKLSDLELAADAHYLFDVGAPVQPYLGGGGGIHLLNGRGVFIDDTFIEDLLDTVTPSLNLVAGVNFPFGSLQFVAEARYVLMSDVRYGTALLGGTWTLPSPPGPTPATPAGP